MKLNLKIVSSIAVAGFVLLFTACNQSGSKTTEEATDISKEEITTDVKAIVYPLPSPFELAQKLEQAGATYLGSVLNSPENIDKYFTEKSKALALGVYGADLSYAGNYNQMQDVQVYSKIVNSLVDELGVEVNFNELMTEDGKMKFENKDSMVNIVSGMVYNTYDFFKTKSEPSLAGLMVAATWIEGLYIATHISEDTFNNYEMVKLIFDQKTTLNKVLDLLAHFKGDERIDSLSGVLEKLNAIYDEAGDSLTKEQLDNITVTIEAVRESIVS